MSRVLTSGWENRCRHPQLITYYESNCQLDLAYPAGGVEGIGTMQIEYQNTVNTYTHEGAAKYNLLDEDPHMYLNLDVFFYDSVPSAIWGLVNNFQARIYWDDKDNSDRGYVALDSKTNMIYWSWSGFSGSTPWIFNLGEWYTVDLHVCVNPAGASIIDLKIDGFDALYVSQDVSCGFTQIDQVWLGGRDEWESSSTWAQKMIYDNLKVNNDKGLAPDNTWPWHLILIGLPINGPGTYTQLEPVPAVPNWQNVDDLAPNDADYNQTTQAPRKDTYHFTNTPVLVLGSPNWAPTRFILRNRHRVAVPTGEGWTPTLRIGAGDHDGNPEQSGSSHKCFEMIWLLNPATGLPWEKDVIDNMEVGGETHI